MIVVTKEEIKALRDRFPGVHVHRTVNKYYVEENPKVVAFLKGTPAQGREKRHAKQ